MGVIDDDVSEVGYVVELRYPSIASHIIVRNHSPIWTQARVFYLS